MKHIKPQLVNKECFKHENVAWYALKKFNIAICLSSELNELRSFIIKQTKKRRNKTHFLKSLFLNAKFA